MLRFSVFLSLLTSTFGWYSQSSCSRSVTSWRLISCRRLDKPASSPFAVCDRRRNRIVPPLPLRASLFDKFASKERSDASTREEEKRTKQNKYASLSSLRFWKSLEQEASNDTKLPEPNTRGMPDLIEQLLLSSAKEEEKQLTIPATAASVTNASTGVDDESSDVVLRNLILGAGTLLVALLAGGFYMADISVTDAVSGFQALVSSPQDFLSNFLSGVEEMGPAAPLYFGILYLVAEILAVPATPLTFSAGYLFGVPTGFTVVLLAATIAASFGFFIGKTVLRTYVETSILPNNPELAKIDRAIGKKGFLLLLLLRLTPLFPFSLSNYVYGASSIDFASYFWATLLGFAPGTLAYVYTGSIGQALTIGEGSQPWYVYAGGFAVLAGLLKLATDVATSMIEAMEQEENQHMN